MSIRQRAVKGTTTRRYHGHHTAQSEQDANSLMARHGFSTETELVRALLRAAAQGVLLAELLRDASPPGKAPRSRSSKAG